MSHDLEPKLRDGDEDIKVCVCGEGELCCPASECEARRNPKYWHAPDTLASEYRETRHRTSDVEVVWPPKKIRPEVKASFDKAKRSMQEIAVGLAEQIHKQNVVGGLVGEDTADLDALREDNRRLMRERDEALEKARMYRKGIGIEIPQNGPDHLVIPYSLAEDLWDWSQSDSLRYWEHKPLSELIALIKRWRIEDARL